MAPLPSNTTAVLYVDYDTCSEGHTLQVRFGTTSSVSEAMDFVDALLTAMASVMFLHTITGARVRDLGGSVTYPVTWTGATTYGTGAGVHNASAYYMDFIGRSIGGRRCRIAVFGVGFASDDTNDDFRITAGESALVQNCLDALEAGAAVPVAIDGDPVSWHQYANIGTNAYWRNHIR